MSVSKSTDSRSTAATPRRKPRHVTECFSGPIEPVRTGFAYMLGLLVVALIMVLLPVAYCALMAAIGYTVCLHAVHDVSILDAGRHLGSGRLWIGRLAVYLAPILAGAVLLLFMAKPLFARPIKRHSLYTLEAGAEPLLYSFVSAVAKMVGAPSPQIIEVNCEVNASASFRRGFLSFFSNDLQLTIGMPLIVGLNTRQLAGVIAHELGHFSQRSAMRLTYVIARINGWFTRVVYERDSWDEQLYQLSHTDQSFWMMLVFMFVRFCLWITRVILFGFMIFAHAISCFMARQMEFNADLHQIRLAGSDAFQSTFQRVHELGASAVHVAGQLHHQGGIQALVDDFPLLVARTSLSIPAEVHAAIRKAMVSGKAKVFDTHPPVHQRTARARAVGAPGVFQLEKPSSLLLRNPEVLCKWVTIGYYQDLLGMNVSPDQLSPVAKVAPNKSTRA